MTVNPHLVSDSSLTLAGPTPKSAHAYVNRVHDLLHTLEVAESALALAWDRELVRVYGYEFLRVPSAGAASDLEKARAIWRGAQAAFEAELQPEAR